MLVFASLTIATYFVISIFFDEKWGIGKLAVESLLSLLRAEAQSFLWF